MSTLTGAPKERIAILDSLRGIAALTVLFHHFLIINPEFWRVYAIPDPADARNFDSTISLMAYTPLHLLWGGLEAVLLFFVLSGFVLALPFQGRSSPDYWTFAVKRVCRIYIPYIAAVLLAVAVLNTRPTFGLPGVSVWFNQFWTKPANAQALLDHIFMLGSIRWNYVNPVIWSLIHEMRISLIFPLLIWAVLRFPCRASLGVSFAISLGMKLAMRVFPADNLFRSLLETGSYLFLFVAGAVLSVHRARLASWFMQLHSRQRISMLAFSLLLLNARWELMGKLAPTAFLAAWLGSIGLVGIMVVYPAASRALDQPVFYWLGRVSYSLYLTHVIFLYTVLYLTHDTLSINTALSVAFIGSLLVAEVFHRLVEVPSMRLGKALANRMKPAAFANVPKTATFLLQTVPSALKPER